METPEEFADIILKLEDGDDIVGMIAKRDATCQAEFKAPLYELVDEFRSGAAEYEYSGAEYGEQKAAQVYNECADKLKAAIARMKEK